MHHLLMLAIPALAIVLTAAIWFVLGRPRYLAIPGGNLPETSEISIVIPARNEEHNIASLLSSIRQQSLAPMEIIVVDDGSTDDTAEVARSKGARVITAEPLPDGWMGKPWACQQGADCAKGNWLLFLDADLLLKQNALLSLSSLSEDESHVYSVCPYHEIKRPYEELSAFFNTLMLAGINAFSSSKSAARDSALFGQCMLISRAHYEQANGHHSVKAKTLENFHLAKKLKELGIGRSCYLGRGLIHMRMFPNGIGELWMSWKKGFSGAAAHTASSALLFSSLWISGMMLTLVCLVILAAATTSGPFIIATCTAYLVNAMSCLVVFRLAGNFSPWNALFFPVSLIFYQSLFMTSLIDKRRGKKTEWKGREVH